MKKNWLLIIFLLSTLVAKANDPDSTNRKWEVGVFYLPSRINSDLINKKLINSPIGFAILLNRSTSGKFSYETGINYKYHWERLLHGDDFEQYIDHNTNIVEVPVKVKYYPFNKSKFSFYFTGGITNSFFFRETFYNFSVIIPYKWIQKSYFLNVNLGIGCQFKVNKRIGVIFETYYCYNLFETKPNENNYDLKTGFFYHF